MGQSIVFACQPEVGIFDHPSGLKDEGGTSCVIPTLGVPARSPAPRGGLTRLAYAHAKEAEIELEPLLKKAGLTLYQIEDPSVRLKVRDQISFLNLAAAALQDDLLGFHLAFDPREIGLLYYVLASSEMMSDALQRAARYSSIVNEGIALKYIDRADVSILFDYVGVGRHLDRHQIEFLVTALFRVCRQLTGLSFGADPRETYPSPRKWLC
jgi:hypothetical protein